MFARQWFSTDVKRIVPEMRTGYFDALSTLVWSCYRTLRICTPTDFFNFVRRYMQRGWWHFLRPLSDFCFIFAGEEIVQLGAHLFHFLL